MQNNNSTASTASSLADPSALLTLETFRRVPLSVAASGPDAAAVLLSAPCRELLLLGAALMLPLIVGLIRTKKPAAGKPAAKPNAKIFFGCAAFLALFIGVSAILAVTTRRILSA